jgi:hypothetical protein
MKIVFVLGPCIPRRNVCRNLLPMAGINLRCVNMFDHLIRDVPSEAVLERNNISLAVSDQFVIDRFNKVIRKHEKTLPANSVLVINGFPYNETQADYLAAAYENSKHKIAILHVEPRVCRFIKPGVYKQYENLVRPAALKLAEDFRTFTLQYEDRRDLRLLMLPMVLRMFKKLKCKWSSVKGPRRRSEVAQLVREVTRKVRVPGKYLLFGLVLEHPKILLECPHVSPALIGA